MFAMKKFILFILVGLVLLSCQSSVPDKSVSFEVNDSINSRTEPSKDSALVNYTTHSPLGVTIDLPEHMKLISENDRSSLDYCDYQIMLDDTIVIGEIHSLTNGRFLLDTITEFYEQAQQNPLLTISYKTQKENWFVVSGTYEKSGAIMYWKRIVSEPYVSDLQFEYRPELKDKIEPYLGRISKSFKDY